MHILTPTAVFSLFCAAALAQATPDAPPAAAAAAPKSAPNSIASLVQRSFVEVARATRPSVVTVRAYVRKAAAELAASDPAQTGWVESEAAEYPGFRLVAAGSGFFIDASGDVLTCHHVLQRPDGSLAELFDVELADGSRVISEVVGAEPTVNLAILHTMVFPNGHPRDVKPLAFGDSDALECGQWVCGAGDPAGPEKFFGVGTFIALPTRDCYQDYLSAFHLQVAMVVPPGAYGGPLVNLDGQVVGILTPGTPKPAGVGLERGSGVEFAQPSKIVTGLYESIRQVRSFQSPWLGFSVMSRAEIAAVRGIEAYNALPKPRAGILVENVWKGSPAAIAGVEPGDFLCGFDTTRIFTPVDFQRSLYLAGIGKTVKLELFRNGETLHKEVAIQRRPPEAAPR